MQATEEQASAVLKIGVEHNYLLALVDGLSKHGWAISLRGQTDLGIAEMQRALAILQAMDVVLFKWDRLSLLAEAYGHAGRLVDALSSINEAIGLIETSGARNAESHAYRVKGDLLLRQGYAAEAEACLQRALDIARSQSAKSWELRAATSIARLWQQQGKRGEARTLLQDVYGWFTEGFDTPDLQDARALLDELA
jgi:predicted ATPase